MKEFILPAVLVAAGIAVTAFATRNANCCDAAKICCEAKSPCCRTASAAADKHDCCEPVTVAEIPHQ